MINEMDRIQAAEMEAAKAANDGVTYHAPTCLSLGAVDLKSVLILGSCQAQSWGFHRKNATDTKCDYVLTNNVAQLEARTAENLAQYDLQILQIPLRALLPDATFWHLSYSDLNGHQVAFDRTVERLTLFLREAMRYNRETGLLTFVANFFVPQQNPMGRLFPKFDWRNPEYFIMRLNEVLENLVAEFKNAYVLDLDRLSAMYGKKYIQDDHIGWFSHGSILPPYDFDRTRIEHAPPMACHHDMKIDQFFSSVWAEVVAMYKTVRQKDQVKLVVVDLDDTIWKGVIGELDDPSGTIIEGWPLGLVEALVYLKKRGVMLGIISKNDETRVRNMWPKVFRDRFSLDDFAVVKINYEPKAVNMADILAAVNVLPSSVVFVDDNPVERASMKAAYPNLRILSRYHYYWRRTVMWAPETQVARLTDESARRTEMMRAQVARESLKQQMTREDFLKSLNLKLRLFPIIGPADHAYSRAFELINKTNQFNTTSARWTSEEFEAALVGGCKVYAFEVNDNFTNYGLVGVLVISGSTIEQMVMSCRVVGMDVELAAVALVIEALRAAGSTALRAKLAHTTANLLCRDLWQRCGFVDTNGQFVLTPEKSVHIPPHITREE